MTKLPIFYYGLCTLKWTNYIKITKKFASYHQTLLGKGEKKILILFYITLPIPYRLLFYLGLLFIHSKGTTIQNKPIDHLNSYQIYKNNNFN